MHVRLVQAANAILGEGPLWEPDEKCLYWIDIVRPAVYRYSPEEGQTGMWILPEKVGCIAMKEPGHLWVACRSGLYDLDTREGNLVRMIAYTQLIDSHRFNDGAVDPCGRLWIGIMSEGTPGQNGSLCRVESIDEVRTIEQDWVCPNGLDWSPDGSVFYAADSGLHTIWRFDYDLASGAAVNRRVFAKLPEGQGVPDGLTVDSEGCVWSAIWDGWRVDRFDPDGRLIQSIAMPVQRPTSVAFGGSVLSTLFVTSASVNVSNDGLRRGSQAGGVFAVDSQIRGLPSRRAHLRVLSQ
ncbi:SMP-30/gluconolactonase/LRE family protein [Comamonas sp. JUb58]|uniref:SMP-30/gluconolactonase/LRE family protein n=1 Tax=Comamonas sp. JUb58 TaxID=2485114 RepID=UPI00105F4093|nr:SMP-30/gluconolactonase/LRE family protein [Comamonas sp. JUb58]TDS70428.1 gluconolactonase [Comamonas sp. JUb58]